MKKQAPRKAIIVMIFFFSTLCLAAFLIWQNNDIVTTRMDCADPDLPDGFDGYKIVHISDLHNKSFGENSARLIEDIQREKPDAIMITGDLIDRKRTDVDAALAFIRKAVDIAPVYFAPGNHEALSGAYDGLKSGLLDCGVTVLEDNAVSIERAGRSITVLGARDIAFYSVSDIGYEEDDCKPYFKESVNLLMQGRDGEFTVLLVHRPHFIDIYAQSGADLVLSGHAHGGQIRLPFIGALLAPEQGFFPRYTSGLHIAGQTTMIISRGLGNSTFPFRVFNRPEIVSVTLKKA